jgi:TolB-like protein/Flp pilus assembly protein TadD
MGDSPSGLRLFLAELKRRRVFRVAVVYAVVTFVIWQAAEIAFPALRLPDWSLTLVVVLTLLGFPIAIVLAWAFEISPQGVKRTEPLAGEAATAKRSGIAMATTAGVAVLALVIAAGWFLLHDRAETSSERKMLVVLPFENLGSPLDEYFADGITDEITSRLAQLPGLGVIARTSAIQYKKTDKTIPQIGQELGVDFVLGGTVRWDKSVAGGSRVRVSARLIRVSDATHLWVQPYEEALADVFQLQAAVAERVAEALNLRLLSGVETPFQGRPTEDLEAYDLYLLGRHHWNRRTVDGITRAIDYFQGAIARDSSYAQAYAGLADAFSMSTALQGVAPVEAFPKAKAAARAALALDSTLAEAHAALGLINTGFDMNWAAAEMHFQRAIERNPNYATAHIWYAYLLVITGRPAEAHAEMMRGRALDPLSVATAQNVGVLSLFLREYDRAVEEFRRILRLDPDFTGAYLFLGLAYLHTSEFGEVRSAWQPLADLLGYGPELERAVQQITDRESSLRAVSVLVEAEPRSLPNNWKKLWVAGLYALLGEHEKALERLELSYEERFPLIGSIAVDPAFDSLRSDPKFVGLIRKMGLEE